MGSVCRCKYLRRLAFFNALSQQARCTKREFDFLTSAGLMLAGYLSEGIAQAAGRLNLDCGRIDRTDPADCARGIGRRTAYICTTRKPDAHEQDNCTGRHLCYRPHAYSRFVPARQCGLT